MLVTAGHFEAEARNKDSWHPVSALMHAQGTNLSTDLITVGLTQGHSSGATEQSKYILSL